MDTTANKNGRSTRDSYGKLKNDASAAAGMMRSAGIQGIGNLLADVEDLMSHVTDRLNPDIERIRAKVESGIADARKALSEGADQVQRQARNAVMASERYVSDNPWTAVGLSAFAGLAVGVLLTRR